MLQLPSVITNATSVCYFEQIKKRIYFQIKSLIFDNINKYTIDRCLSFFGPDYIVPCWSWSVWHCLQGNRNEIFVAGFKFT